MKKLIKQLEIMGQSQSLKQHASLNDMITANLYDKDLIEEAFNNSHELICAVEPQDDQE